MRSSIHIPVKFATGSVLNTLIQYGKLVKNGNRYELVSVQTRHILKDLENFLQENKVPYDLIQYPDLTNTPRVKRVRPERNYSKEIPCLICTGQEDGDEDGLIRISELQEILDKENLLIELQSLISAKTFKFQAI